MGEKARAEGVFGNHIPPLSREAMLVGTADGRTVDRLPDEVTGLGNEPE